jgi:hypothetical protein
VESIVGYNCIVWLKFDPRFHFVLAACYHKFSHNTQLSVFITVYLIQKLLCYLDSIINQSIDAYIYLLSVPVLPLDSFTSTVFGFCRFSTQTNAASLDLHVEFQIQSWRILQVLYEVVILELQQMKLSWHWFNQLCWGTHILKNKYTWEHYDNKNMDFVSLRETKIKPVQTVLIIIT